ncbi:MAG: D-alanyl-D-alanine carboxypeptidase [Pseudomonadota bacterium]|nr:D-alanyl-D-alanine carboxypeptidase [Pseudomonadota bacterium]
MLRIAKPCRFGPVRAGALARLPFIFALMVVGITVAQPLQAQPPYASIVVDARSGAVIHEFNADHRGQPASLTKMMTLYLVFEALEQQQLRLDQQLRVSAHASRMQATRLGLRRGQIIPVDDAILALITHSANDAAVVLAEALGATETNFARLMTVKARYLGMPNTRFYNASGLPDRRQYSCARDMVTLGLALLNDFPRHYPLFATKHFRYKGRFYRNHNHLLGGYAGSDGIKTGYVRASGFNLVASARRGDRRLLAAVLGGRSARSRDRQMVELLDAGFTSLAGVKAVASLAGPQALAAPPKRGRYRAHAARERLIPATTTASAKQVEPAVPNEADLFGEGAD